MSPTGALRELNLRGNMLSVQAVAMLDEVRCVGWVGRVSAGVFVESHLRLYGSTSYFRMSPNVQRSHVILHLLSVYTTPATQARPGTEPSPPPHGPAQPASRPPRGGPGSVPHQGSSCPCRTRLRPTPTHPAAVPQRRLSHGLGRNAGGAVGAECEWSFCSVRRRLCQERCVRPYAARHDRR